MAILGGIINAWLVTFYLPTAKEANAMLDRLINDKELIPHMCYRINQLKKLGHYNGAYECVKLAVGKK